MILFLIGFRATGKTSIGPLLAGRLNCHWLDSDGEIEKFAQRDIPTIFQQDGEAGFRSIERNVIKLLVDRTRCSEMLVMSTGGGAIIDPETRKLIKDRGQAVWLTASPECLAKRIQQDRTTIDRPALTDMPLQQEVATLLKTREPFYSDCADFSVDTEFCTIEEVVDRIAGWWPGADKKQ